MHPMVSQPVHCLRHLLTVPTVTDDNAHANRRMGGAAGMNDKIIHVQPLKKSEMQPSYGQDLGTGDVRHGVYGSLLNILGDTVWFIGAVPCCPCPNPYRNVQQGM